MKYLSKGYYYDYYSLNEEVNPLCWSLTPSYLSFILNYSMLIKFCLFVSLVTISMRFGITEYIYNNGGHWENWKWHNHPPSPVFNHSMIFSVFVIGRVFKHLLKRVMSHFTLSYTVEAILLLIISLFVGNQNVIIITSITTLVSLILDWKIITSTREYLISKYNQDKNNLLSVLNDFDIDEFEEKMDRSVKFDTEGIISYELEKMEKRSRIFNYDIFKEFKLINLIKNWHILRFLKGEDLNYE